MNAPGASPQDEQTELLKRLLSAVEPAKRRRGFELICAIVLSLATTASAWCAYQAKRWGGAQFTRAGAAFAASQQAAVSSIAAVQVRTFDAAMLIDYMEARLETNQALETFLSRRFRPEMKRAFDAWMALDPLSNAAAPPSPLHMPEYVPRETTEADRQAEIARTALAGSRQARQISDDYVLLTVIFASVLFFGGIARVFEARHLRFGLAGLAVVMFLVTLAALATMPFCRD